MTDEKKPETFEQGLARLENIVSDLEGKRMSLDAAVKAFEEGAVLSDELGRLLTEAEARLENINKGPDGRPRTKPMTRPLNRRAPVFDPPDYDPEGDE